MMNGLVPIKSEEYTKYFECCSDFYYQLDIESGASFAFLKETKKLVAYRDIDGECFSRSCYWKV